MPLFRRVYLFIFVRAYPKTLYIPKLYILPSVPTFLGLLSLGVLLWIIIMMMIIIKYPFFLLPHSPTLSSWLKELHFHSHLIILLYSSQFHFIGYFHSPPQFLKDILCLHCQTYSYFMDLSTDKYSV